MCCNTVQTQRHCRISNLRSVRAIFVRSVSPHSPSAVVTPAAGLVLLTCTADFYCLSFFMCAVLMGRGRGWCVWTRVWRADCFGVVYSSDVCLRPMCYWLAGLLTRWWCGVTLRIQTRHCCLERWSASTAWRSRSWAGHGRWSCQVSLSKQQCVYYHFDGFWLWCLSLTPSRSSQKAACSENSCNFTVLVCTWTARKIDVDAASTRQLFEQKKGHIFRHANPPET